MGVVDKMLASHPGRWGGKGGGGGVGVAILLVGSCGLCANLPYN